MTLGTGGHVSTSFHAYKKNRTGNLQVFCGNEPGLWTAFGCGMAGAAFEWLKDTFYTQEVQAAKSMGIPAYDMLMQAADQVQPGSDGLLFYPMFQGQRAPVADNNTRGSFVGITLLHEKKHFLRSAMEGIVFGIKATADLICEIGGPIETLTLNGGGASSLIWCQMVADIFGCETRRLKHFRSSGSMGAAMITGVGIGLWNLQEAADMHDEDIRVSPRASRTEIYKEVFENYKSLYPALKDIFAGIAAMEEKKVLGDAPMDAAK